MAKINFTSAIVAVGVGGVDELLEDMDAKAKNASGGPAPRVAPFKRWSDWGRIGLAIAGYVGTSMNMFPEYAKPMSVAATTLATKSAIQAIRYDAPSGTPAASRFARAAQGVSGKVSNYQNLNPRPKLV